MRTELKKQLLARGSVSKAARTLGVSRQYLHILIHDPGTFAGYWVARGIEQYTNHNIKVEDLVNPAKRSAFDEGLSG